MSPRRYDELKMEFSDESGKRTRVSDLIKEASNLAAKGQRDEAYTQFMGLAETLMDYGLPDISLEILEDLESALDAASLKPTDYAWFLNLRARALGTLGRHSEAISLLSDVLDIGNRLDDLHIQSIALQNLGGQSQYSGALEEARMYYARSLELMIRRGDNAGAVSVLLNLASVLENLDLLEDADKILDDLEPLLTEYQDQALLVTLAGLKANIAGKRGDFSLARDCSARAVRLARRIGDQTSLLNLFQNCGMLNFQQGRLLSAAKWFRRALRVASTLNLRVKQKALRRNLAGTLQKLGRINETLDELQQVRDLAEEVGDLHDWAVATAEVGALTVQHGLGVDAGESLLRAARLTFSELHDLSWEADTVAYLAQAHASTGDNDAALSELNEGMRLLESASVEVQVRYLKRAGNLCLSSDLGPTNAVSYFRVAMKRLVQSDPERISVGWEALAFANRLVSVAAHDLAVSFFSDALDSFRASRNHQMVLRTLSDRGIALLRANRTDEAEEDFEAAAVLALRHRDRIMRARVNLNYGELLRRRGEYGRAQRRTRSALRLADELQDTELAADSLHNLALTLADKGQWSQAASVYQQLADRGRVARRTEWNAIAETGLGDTSFRRRRYDEAARHYATAAGLAAELGDKDRLFEDLAGMSESFAMLKRPEELERAAQRLLDLARDEGLLSRGVEAASRIARLAVRSGLREEAVSLYAAAVVQEAMKDVEDDAQLLLGVIQVFLRMIIATRLDQIENGDELFAEVLLYLDQRYEGLGSSMRVAFEMARDGADSVAEVTDVANSASGV